MKNKKGNSLLLAAVLCCFVCHNLSLNAQSFKKGSIAINAGIGVLSSISYYSGSGASRSPVIAASGEYGIAQVGPGIIGGGIALGYQSASYTYNNGSYYYKDKWSTTLFGLRATYHPDFLNTDKYDVYGVVQLSFDHFGYKFSSSDPYYNTYGYGRSSLSSYVRPSFLVGGRYYFTNAVGAFAEVGYDISYLKFGITFKFDTKGGSQ